MRTPQKNEPIMDFLSPSATRTRWNTTEGRDHDRRIFLFFEINRKMGSMGIEPRTLPSHNARTWLYE